MELESSQDLPGTILAMRLLKSNCTPFFGFKVRI